MSTNILIEATATNGKKVQRAITNVNPAAGNGALKNLAQSLNSLTSNTYVGTTRIDRIDITDFFVYPNPHFTPTQTTVEYSTLTAAPLKIELNPVYVINNSEEIIMLTGMNPRVEFDPAPSYEQPPFFVHLDEDEGALYILKLAATLNQDIAIKISVPAGEVDIGYGNLATYGAFSTTITVTAN